MTDNKVIFRANMLTEGERSLTWEPGCPVLITAVQIARDTMTAEANLQVRAKNVSNETISSISYTASIVGDDGAQSEVKVVDLDFNASPGEEKELKATPLTCSDAVTAVVKVQRIRMEVGQWISTTDVERLPKRAKISLVGKAAKERKQLLTDGRVVDDMVQDHGTWWVCACGQINVGRSTCCECGSDKDVIQSLEDGKALVTAANEWNKSVYNRATELKGAKTDAIALAEAARLYKSIPDWKDSAKQAIACEEAANAVRAATSRKKMSAIFAFAIIVVIAIAGTLAFANASGQRQQQQQQLQQQLQQQEFMDAYVGAWTLESGSDKDLTAENVTALSKAGWKITMTLEEDGTGSLNMPDEQIDFTWNATSEGATVIAKGNEAALKLEGSKLVLVNDAGVSMTFVSSDAASTGNSAGAAGSARTGAKNTSYGNTSYDSRESSRRNTSDDSISYGDGDYEYMYTNENGESMYYDSETGNGIWVDKNGNKEWTDGYGNHHSI